MDTDKISSIVLDQYQTKDITDGHVNGKLTVIWRDWDNILKIHPKMVYVSSVFPGETKGPHLHTKRHSYFICIRGKVVFIIRDFDGKYHEIESGENNPVLVQIPKNFASAHINISKELSTVLTLAEPAWQPEDDEMKNVTFNDYDWNKWKNVIQ